MGVSSSENQSKLKQNKYLFLNWFIYLFIFKVPASAVVQKQPFWIAGLDPFPTVHLLFFILLNVFRIQKSLAVSVCGKASFYPGVERGSMPIF